MRFIALLLLLPCINAWPGQDVEDFRISRDGEFVVLESRSGTRAVVAPDRGGELAGLSILVEGKPQELLYRALDYEDQPGWRGKAPLLWPATGRTLSGVTGQNTYRLGDKSFEMPIHGFVRDHRWTVAGQRQSADMASVTLQLSDSPRTRRHYPFGFELQVEYRLQDDQLGLLYRVTADAGNQQEMSFSIGNHITFKAPLIDGPDASELQFENDFPDRLITGENKVFTGVVKPSALRGRHGLLALPRRNSVSLGGREGTAALTIHDPSGLQLRLQHQATAEPVQPAIQFNLWADAESGFFSPEPWVGAQNSLNTGLGLIYLQPGQSWHWRVDIIPTWPEPAATSKLSEIP